MKRYNNTYPDKTYSNRAAHINEYIYGSPFTGQLNEFDQEEHSGKGPGGYKITDRRIYELVCESLLEDPEINASEIEVHVEDGQVYLTGTVENRHMKKLAERNLGHVPGIKDVRNLLLLKNRSYNERQ